MCAGSVLGTLGCVLSVPETRYVKSGDVHIAYQVVGDGPRDLVFLSSWDMAIDFLWDEPSQVQFFERLASFSRLILFDKRGTGTSDSVSPEAMPTLESWVDDVRLVMDAVGSERAAIVACTFTGPLAACSPPRARSAPQPWCLPTRSPGTGSLPTTRRAGPTKWSRRYWPESRMSGAPATS